MSRVIFKISDLFDLSGAVIYNPDFFNATQNISIDSRSIKKGSIFIAIKGGNFDGHEFVESAVKKGANTVIIKKRNLRYFDKLTCTIVTVPDTTVAYGELASIKRNRLRIPVISLTGSNGKTSTKEILATLLGERFKVHKTLANNNNHIGVPLTLLSCKSSAEIVVLEHGTNHFGEIKYTADIATPDVALITNIASSHTEYLKDINGVLEEKIELLNSTKGKVFINSDDSSLKSVKRKFHNLASFGFLGKPESKGKIISVDDYGRPTMEIQTLKRCVTVKLPLLGKANAKNFLAAASVAMEFGVTKKELIAGAKKLNAVPGRLEYKIFGSSMIIDDTYNASPSSMESSFNVLKQIKAFKTKSLFLGDMFELGKDAPEMHKDLSDKILKSKIDEVFTIGKNMKLLHSEIEGKVKNAKHFNSRKRLLKYITTYDCRNKVVLVKGSRGMKMEEFGSQLSRMAT